MKNIIRSILPYSWLIFLKKIVKEERKPFFLNNINWKPNDSSQKKVLISYVFGHLVQNAKEGRFGTRSQECATIMNEFISNGYAVDVIDYRDEVNKSNVLNNHYDMIFGFGVPFNYLVETHSAKNKILYLTEKHPVFSFKKEKERVAYYKQRHNKQVKLSRTFLNYGEENFKNIDAIVYIGNPSEAGLIPVNVPKYPIRPTGLINADYVQNQRNIEKTKKGFIWFGSQGAIHKGLDLLIDVFRKENDCTLYICGLSQLDKKLLPKFDDTQNIIDLGFVNVQSPNFLEIVNQCSFVILPSCSEALSTGVITCMNHGLIPIVTKETGFEFTGFGFVLQDFQIDYLTKIIKEVVSASDAQILNEHKLAYDYARKNFSLTNFHDTFANILQNIL